MNLNDLTPAECMNDEEYKSFIINKYGHIQGLARTMLYLRSSLQRRPNENGEDTDKKRVTKGDIAAYCRIIEDIDASRKMLNKLHMRLTYLQKEKTLANMSFHEIRDIIHDTNVILSHTENICLRTFVEYETDEILTDFKDD